MSILLFRILIYSIFLLNVIHCKNDIKNKTQHETLDTINNKNINKNDNINTNISIDDQTQKNNEIKNEIKRTATDDNSIFQKDELYFNNDFNEKFDFLQSERETNILDIIPIHIGYYKEVLNFDLHCIPKLEEKNTFRNKKFTLLDFNTSFIITYKLRPLHDKFWNHFINKNANNKFARYMKSHFMTSIGLFYENNTHQYYYNYSVEDRGDTSIKKNLTTYIGIRIMRLGLLLKETWILDSSGKFNLSLLLSFGWQTNFYLNNCCCFHYKDTWVSTTTDYKGFDKWGYENYSQILDISMRNIFGLIQLDFGFYFLKLYVRFTSPIGKNKVEKEINKEIGNNDKYTYREEKSSITIPKDNKNKNLILNKWNISIGLGLTL